MNVDGTRKILDLVQQTRGRRLHHVSTAYVAGTKDFATEAEINTGQTFRNATKPRSAKLNFLWLMLREEGPRRQDLSAKHCDRGQHHGEERRISTASMRSFADCSPAPTAAAKSSSNGAGSSSRARSRKNQYDSELRSHRLCRQWNGAYRRPGEQCRREVPSCEPVSDTERPLAPTHLPAAPRYGSELVDQTAFNAVPPTKMETGSQKQMAFYYMYLQGVPRFHCSRTLDALRGTGIECPCVTVDFIETIVGWYVEYLKASQA